VEDFIIMFCNGPESCPNDDPEVCDECIYMEAETDEDRQYLQKLGERNDIPKSYRTTPLKKILIIGTCDDCPFEEFYDTFYCNKADKVIIKWKDVTGPPEIPDWCPLEDYLQE
jgi:hypothetical protein